jgi:hypothetical protein
MRALHSNPPKRRRAGKRLHKFKKPEGRLLNLRHNKTFDTARNPCPASDGRETVHRDRRSHGISAKLYRSTALTVNKSRDKV